MSVAMKPFGAVARGYYALSADGEHVTGWVVSDHEAGKGPLAIILGETMIAQVLPNEERPASAPSRAHGFTWRIPDLLHSRSAALKIIDLASGDPLEGEISFAAAEMPLAAGLTAWGQEPAYWVRGVAGNLDICFNHLAQGLWVDVDPHAAHARFCRADAPSETQGHPGWGMRLTSDNEVTWRVSQQLLPQLAQAEGEQFLRLWIKLAFAVANFSQRHCEIFLARWNGQRFEPLRRLRRGRVLRRFSFIDVALTLDEAERAMAAAGELVLSVVTQACTGVVVCPVVPSPAVTTGARFEDNRLTGAFDAAERLTRILDEDLGRALLLKEAGPSLPAAAASEEAPFTEIVVPVYNGHDIVMRCLRSIQANTDTPFSVLIIDDGSRGYTTLLLDQIVAEDPRFKMHRRAINRGYTKSVNESLKLTTADWVVILNSDTVVSKGWLGKLHQAARAVPDAGLIGPLSNAATWQSVPQAKNADGSWSQNDFISPEQLDRVQEKVEAASECAYPSFPVLNGFCTLIARRVFDTIGLFDEEAFPQGYGEETDVCLRAGLAGFKLVVADNCFVYHEKNVSFGSATRSKLTRAGGFELRNKHPGINIAAVERLMQANPAMLRLRSKLNDLESELQV